MLVPRSLCSFDQAHSAVSQPTSEKQCGMDVQPASHCYPVVSLRPGWCREWVNHDRYWALAARPVPPWPQADTFVLKKDRVPTPGSGQALTRMIHVSLDPYQWGYKRRRIEPAGSACHARTVSQVIESRMDGFAAGDFVSPAVGPSTP